MGGSPAEREVLLLKDRACAARDLGAAEPRSDRVERCSFEADATAARHDPRCSWQAIAKAETVRGTQRGRVGAFTLCLGKTPGQDGLAVLLLLIPCERQPTADESVASKADAKCRQRCVGVVAPPLFGKRGRLGSGAGFTGGRRESEGVEAENRGGDQDRRQ